MEVLYNASTYRDDEGQVVGVVAAARDITARKQAETALADFLATLAVRNASLILHSGLSDTRLREVPHVSQRKSCG